MSTAILNEGVWSLEVTHSEATMVSLLPKITLKSHLVLKIWKPTKKRKLLNIALNLPSTLTPKAIVTPSHKSGLNCGSLSAVAC